MADETAVAQQEPDPKAKPVQAGEWVEDVPERVHIAFQFVQMCNGATPVFVYNSGSEIHQVPLPKSQEVPFRFACRVLANYFEEGLEEYAARRRAPPKAVVIPLSQVPFYHYN